MNIYMGQSGHGENMSENQIIEPCASIYNKKCFRVSYNLMFSMAVIFFLFNSSFELLGCLVAVILSIVTCL